MRQRQHHTGKHPVTKPAGVTEMIRDEHAFAVPGHESVHGPKEHGGCQQCRKSRQVLSGSEPRAHAPVQPMLQPDQPLHLYCANAIPLDRIIL